jgi:hypothetical protein
VLASLCLRGTLTILLCIVCKSPFSYRLISILILQLYCTLPLSSALSVPFFNPPSICLCYIYSSSSASSGQSIQTTHPKSAYSTQQPQQGQRRLAGPSAQQHPSSASISLRSPCRLHPSCATRGPCATSPRRGTRGPWTGPRTRLRLDFGAWLLPRGRSMSGSARGRAVFSSWRRLCYWDWI